MAQTAVAARTDALLAPSAEALAWLATARIKVFADGADLASLLALQDYDFIRGYTTNPTLMRQAGVASYEDFARAALEVVTERPISFEVLADEFDEMERQALKIATWGKNVYVKIPVANTRGDSAAPLVKRLTQSGVQVNVTAMLTLEQVHEMGAVLAGGAPSILSVFAGRVADTGRDPMPLMSSAVEFLASEPNIELLWASPRELLNLFQAETCGCHIVTVTPDVLKKLKFVGRDLTQYSLETVQMFRDDAVQADYRL